MYDYQAHIPRYYVNQVAFGWEVGSVHRHDPATGTFFDAWSFR